jgi:hypothetical protein
MLTRGIEAVRTRPRVDARAYEMTIEALDQTQIRRLLDLGRGLVATLNVEAVLD